VTLYGSSSGWESSVPDERFAAAVKSGTTGPGSDSSRESGAQQNQQEHGDHRQQEGDFEREVAEMAGEARRHGGD
jgi:hypothetical protein